jgi:hypothetical protein
VISPRSQSNRTGSAAVEFALTVPILLVIVFGVLDYSWYIKQATDVVRASREGLRLGVTVAQADGPDAAAETQVGVVLAGYGLDCDGDLDCEIEASNTTVDGLDAVTLTVSVPYQPLVGMVPTPETMGAVITMALEDQS